MLQPNLSDTIFEPEDPLDRSSITLRILRGSAIFIATSLLACVFIKGVKEQPSIPVIFTLIMIGIVVFLNSFSRIVRKITFSINTQSIIIEYETLWEKKKDCVIPFDNFSYDHFEKPSADEVRKSVIAFYSGKKLVYTIDDQNDGFDYYQFEEIEAVFNDFKFPMKGRKNL